MLSRMVPNHVIVLQYISITKNLTESCFFDHKGWVRVIGTNCTCTCAQNNKLILNGDSKYDTISWLYFLTTGPNEHLQFMAIKKTVTTLY